MAQVSSGSRIRAQPVVGMVEAQGCSIGISGVSDRRYAAPERLAAMLTAPLCINRSYPGSHVTWPEDATLGIGCGWSSVLQAKKGRKRQATGVGGTGSNPSQADQGPFTGQAGVVDLCGLGINDGAILPAIVQSVRTIIARYRAAWVSEIDDINWTFTGTWGTVSGAGHNSGTGYRRSNVNGDTFKCVMPADYPGTSFDLGLVCDPAAGAGTQVAWAISSGGGVSGVTDLSGATNCDSANSIFNGVVKRFNAIPPACQSAVGTDFTASTSGTNGNGGYIQLDTSIDISTWPSSGRMRVANLAFTGFGDEQWEDIDYATLDAGNHRVTGITRGVGGTSARAGTHGEHVGVYRTITGTVTGPGYVAPNYAQIEATEETAPMIFLEGITKRASGTIFSPLPTDPYGQLTDSWIAGADAAFQSLVGEFAAGGSNKVRFVDVNALLRPGGTDSDFGPFSSRDVYSADGIHHNDRGHLIRATEKDRVVRAIFKDKDRRLANYMKRMTEVSFLSVGTPVAWTMPNDHATTPPVLYEFMFDFLLRRKQFDLSPFTECRILVNSAVAGPTNTGGFVSSLGIQYSDNGGSTFQWLNEGWGQPQITINVAGLLRVGGWNILSGRAHNDVQLRVVGFNGDGTTSPSFTEIALQLR